QAELAAHLFRIEKRQRRPSETRPSSAMLPATRPSSAMMPVILTLQLGTFYQGGSVMRKLLFPHRESSKVSSLRPLVKLFLEPLEARLVPANLRVSANGDYYGETAIAIDSNHPNHMLIGANDEWTGHEVVFSSTDA